MIPFRDISLVLSYARGSGKTYNMIKNAQKDAFILARDESNARHIRDTACNLARHDLKIIVPNENNLKGLHGVFHADHWALQLWLSAAADKIDDLEEQNRLLKRELE